TLSGSAATLVNDGDCAYVSVNRLSSSATNLTVTVANIASVPVADDVFIIARRWNNDVIVGSGLHLIPGESSTLDDASSDQLKQLIGGSVTAINDATTSAQ